MRLLAIGDIHGHSEKLKKLMEQVEPTEEDQVVFLGDYIDRGPDSRGVVYYLIQFRQRFPKTVFLLGNHEQMMLDFLKFKNPEIEWTPLKDQSPKYAMENAAVGPDIWLMNGGDFVLQEYRGSANVPQEHVDFLRSCQLYAEFDRYVFAHASVSRYGSLETQDAYDLLWDRQPVPEAPLVEGKTVVVGHTPQRKLEVGEYRINLDSGSGYGKQHPLTCMDVLTGQVWQARIDSPEWLSTEHDFPQKAGTIFFLDNKTQKESKAYFDGREFWVQGEKMAFKKFSFWRKG